MSEPLAVREAPAKYQVVLDAQRVRPGYKQTDLGIIPEDWDVIPMGQISQCLIGLTYSPLDVRDFGTLVLRSSNVQNGRLEFDDNVFVDMDIPARAITRENDILICVRNGSRQLIGKCALIGGKTAGSAFGAFMSVLRSDSAKFLFFEFQSSILKRQIDEVMGATINQITNKNMAAFKVIWPPTKAEQEAIAEALSDADTLIESLEQLITKKRHLKQGAMQELLTGKKRLPEFSGKWEAKPIGEVFSIKAGTSKRKFISNGGRFLIVDMGSVSIEGKLISTKRTDYCEDMLSRGDLVMPKDDIGGGNIIGKAAYIDEDNRYVLGDHVYVLSAKDGHSPFLSYVINAWPTNSALRKKVGGSAQLMLNRKSVEEQGIPFPTPKEQIAIATILSDMDTEIAALETRLAKTRELKQGMMHNLLTGRIRLV